MSIPSQFAHQKKTVAFHKKTDIVFDMSDPGTGKTRGGIDAFSARRRKGGKAALIIAPKSLLDSAWKEDFSKFAPDMRVIAAYAENREEAFEMDCDAYITNHDATNWLVKQKPAFFKRFDTLIIDESTAFKHQTSKRSKALAKISKYFQYRTCMTGTPISNGVCDIWHQTFILDGGARLGNSFFKFRSSACEPEQVGPMPQMVKWNDRPGIENVVSALLKDITIRHVFEECVDIPPNHRYAVYIDLNKKHAKTYLQMQEDQMAQIKDKVVTAVNGAVVYGKLLQIASGAVYSGDGTYSLVDTQRYEVVMDLVEARKHSIVFFTWEHQRDELIREAEARGFTFAVYDGGTNSADRSRIVKDYQAGKYKVLLAHPQSAGHGLTLVKGTATIWASPTYNLEHFLQGLKRVHRIGQTEKTETIVVVARGTIDEKVWEVAQRKDAKQKDLLEML
jgi:SNF2 family DNA or RNA helicase